VNIPFLTKISGTPTKTRMTKSGLGRGLGALLSEQKAGSGESAADDPQPLQPDGEVERVIRVAVTDIKPCPSQPRKDFDRAALEDLAVSLTSTGFIQPLVARATDDDKYELIAGERRWRAAQIAKIDVVPVVVREASDEKMLEMALVENLQREDLNPIEEAQGFALLIEAFGLTQEDAAQRIGKSRAAVANALRLLNLGEDLQAHLREGRLSVGHAKVILGLDDPEQQSLTSQRVIEHAFTVRETEELVGRLQAGPEGTSTKKAGGSTPAPDVHSADLERRLTEALGTKVALRYRAGKGSLNIKFFSDDDLERILKLLGVEEG